MLDLRRDVDALVPHLEAIRQDIHKHPELGFEEERTQRLVRHWLTQLGYATRDVAITGVVADLRPDLVGRARTVALRADMDCLPMQETTDLPYRSVHDGRAHKCGHDGHTAVMLGVAAILARYREQLPGNVRLVFQPAEEGVDGGGARRMVAEGVLDQVDEIYGMHNWPGFPLGELRVRSGPTMAQVHDVEIEVSGVGGHASQPQTTRDPIVAASSLVSSLQSVVSRGLGYDGGAVVSICSFHAGSANNVIPERATLSGTVRSFSEEVSARVLARMDEVCRGAGETFGVGVELHVDAMYPVLVNDRACAEAVAHTGAALLGDQAVSDAGLPIAAAEDFGYFTRKVPGAYFFLGAGVGAHTPTCHHPDFDFDDRLLPVGVEMFCRLALDRLG